MAMESQEVSARLERATRSALASSSFTLPLSPSPPAPSLSDLLSHLGPPDSLRCSHCHSPLLRGPQSLFCFACGAPFQSPSPPNISFRSSLAHRRLLDSLQIEGLEANSEVPGDESPVVKLDAGNWINHGAKEEQELSKHDTLPSSFLDPEMKHVDKSFNSGQYPVPVSTSLDTAVSVSGRSVETSVSESVLSPKRDSIVDYSAKLEGISLEDFFSTHSKSQDTVVVAALENSSGSMEGLNTQNGPQNSFWDALIEHTISDGDHTTSREFEFSNMGSSKEHGQPKTDNPDDDESWESDFQSAAPAADMSTAESSTFEQNNAPSIQPGYFNNFFVSSEMHREFNFSDGNSKGGFPDLAETIHKENTTSIIEMDNDIFGLHPKHGQVRPFSSDNLQETVRERPADLDDFFFGSSWQKNVIAPSAKDVVEGFSDRISVGECLINSAVHRKEDDLLQSPLSNHQGLDSLAKGIKTTTLEHCSHHGGDQLPKTLEMSQGKADQMVRSLVAQLHDLSFMLAGKLVIRSENHLLDLGE